MCLQLALALLWSRVVVVSELCLNIFRGHLDLVLSQVACKPAVTSGVTECRQIHRVGVVNLPRAFFFGLEEGTTASLGDDLVDGSGPEGVVVELSVSIVPDL
jgi:hypothetical protein